MATLNELKTQITNANALGREKITSKGGTVAQDADTVAIMGAIDSIPAGGAITPDFVMDATPITWDGDITGKESVELEAQGGKYTYYKVSDKVLPFYYSGESIINYSCIDSNNEEYSPNAVVSVDGYLILAGAVISAYYDNYTSALWDSSVIAPLSGTWFRKDDVRYIKSVSISINP